MEKECFFHTSVAIWHPLSIFIMCLPVGLQAHGSLELFNVFYSFELIHFLNLKPMSLSGSIFQESWQLLNGSIFWKLLCSRQFDGWFRNLSINWQSGYFAFYRIVKEICHFSKWIYHHVRKEGKWYFPKEYGQKDIDGLKYCRSLKIMKIFSTSMGSVNRTISKKWKYFFFSILGKICIW